MLVQMGPTAYAEHMPAEPRVGGLSLKLESHFLLSL
jgi:hypothetical protein